ncbi:MAG: undecaprenyl-diphosphatase [Myxococcales bacterium]|nr:undecaprenyl-diphosphatase [Myxococcales bacterium]
MIWVWICIAAVIQGITEFLPVSSSGHLRIVSELFSPVSPDTGTDVMLHLATLLSVVWVFRIQLKKTLTVPSEQDTDRVPPTRFLGWVILATVPVGVVGMVFGDRLEAASTGLGFLAATYLGNALILWLAHRASRRENRLTLKDFTWLFALLIGLAQAVAVTRGISRSGSTITMALILGFEIEAAAFFSFMIAIPAILGAVAVKIGPVVMGSESLSVALGPMALGFGLAFIVGVGALKVLLASARRAIWWPYVLYSLGLSILCLGLRVG